MIIFVTESPIFITIVFVVVTTTTTTIITTIVTSYICTCWPSSELLKLLLRPTHFGISVVNTIKYINV
jgi:hypothetical protein